MADYRRRGDYIQGNTVRKIAEAPERAPRRRAHPKRTASYQVRRNRERALQMSRGYIFALVLSAVVLAGLGIWYVNMKTSCEAAADQVTSLQEKLETKTESNDALYDSIIDSVDLSEIRERALEKGMQPADEDQEQTYSGAAKDHITQYEAIPKSGTLAESDTTTD